MSKQTTKGNTMEKLTPQDKAFKINQDASIYGTFAEIGAGQEVARSFFRVPGASQTVAKTMSAYDMVFSDAIYGAEKSGRYVCESRLVKMLNHEFDLVLERLAKVKGSERQFFAFADTVAAKSSRVTKNWHGWMGLRFQTHPGGPANNIVVHVKMHDTRNILQQEALGIVGVNLIYGAFFLRHNPAELVASLIDGLQKNRVEVDLVRLTGPDVAHIDNRIVGLHLVEHGMTSQFIIQPNGETAQASDILYNKDVLVQRGNFRPVSLVNEDMHHLSLARFEKEPDVKKQNILSMMEIPLSNLKYKNTFLDVEDYRSRLQLLAALGHTVMITNYPDYHHINLFLKSYTHGKIGIVMGVGHLNEIFNINPHAELEGGLLEAMGKLFTGSSKLYIYPANSLSLTQPSFCEIGKPHMFTADNFEVAPHLTHLYQQFLTSQKIESLKSKHPEYLHINNREIADQIEGGHNEWIPNVPKKVAEIIRKNGLFNCKG